MTKNWYVVYTRPRNEKRVTERLLAGGFEVYCPLIKTLRQWSDRKKMITVPMFTSYIFTKLMAKEREVVLQDPGILNFIYWQGAPVVIDEGEIELIKKIEQNGLEIEVSGDQPSHGQIIKITKGVFKGMSGEVRRVNKSRVSVWIESVKCLITFSYELN